MDICLRSLFAYSTSGACTRKRRLGTQKFADCFSSVGGRFMGEVTHEWLM